MIPVITIDGPSGTGKGTMSQKVALQTGFAMLDSGALYRLTALNCLLNEVDLGKEVEVAAVAEGLNIEFAVKEEGRVEVLLDGNNVSSDIRAEHVGMSASKVAAYPAVRAALLERQKAFKKEPGLVADGRDMGTVVFPDAQVKIFLTASAEERAKRRVKQLEDKGEVNLDFAQIKTDIEARDERDRTRTTSPLVPADDAIEIDTTSMSVDDVFETIMSLVNERITIE